MKILFKYKYHIYEISEKCYSKIYEKYPKKISPYYIWNNLRDANTWNLYDRLDSLIDNNYIGD